MEKTQRIRDPIHKMIVFDREDPVDRTAWRLLATPEMQRLRRVRQLGVSEFVYPSATHTRFAHSVGVFHTARKLVQLIRDEIDRKRAPGAFDEHRAKVAAFAALLHDVGHGPFSHSFEEARKSIAERRARGKAGKIKKHESFSASMVRDRDGEIAGILSDAEVDPEHVAQLIEAETPVDMYHAVVSSSFDADRLDYLQRDRYMTGVGAGAIDLEWLLDNVRVSEIDMSPAGDNSSAPAYRHSFCLSYKAREAAEDFLLARNRLYTNVYFHKTTRGIEQLLSAFFRTIAERADEGVSVSGITPQHPLLRFFATSGETLTNYKALDDAVVWGAIHLIATDGQGFEKDVCSRLLARQKPLCLDVQIAFPDEPELQRRLKHRLDAEFKDEIGRSIFRDTARLSLYGEIGADDERAQKRLMILLPNREPKEITTFLDSTVAHSGKERLFERYYFLNDKDRKRAEAAEEAVRRRQ